MAYELSYILPLDGLDISYLSQHVRRWHSEAPLWTKQALDGEKYYEVIVTSEVTSNDEDCFVQSDTYKCHTCNIDVPLPYLDEHYKGKNHEKHKQIFDQALKQMSKKMNAKFHDKNCTKPLNTYYCDMCCKIIHIDNKKKHDKSSHHKESKEKDKIIDKFIDIFVDNDDVQSMNNVKNDCKVVNIDTKEKGAAGIESGDVKHKTYDVNLVSNNNNNTNKTHDDAVDDAVVIKNDKGMSIKVDVDSFNSYKYVGDRLYCQMCKLWISDSKVHDGSTTHLEKILTSVGEHFTRNIDSTYSHCLVCNDIVISPSGHHYMNENHKNILKHQLGKKIVFNNDQVEQIFCSVCNIYVDTHNFNAHLTSRKHNKKLGINRSNSLNNINDIENVSLKLTNVGNHNKITDHRQTSNSFNKHTAKTDVKTKKNYETLVEQTFCSVCNIYVDTHNFNAHLTSIKHNKKLGINGSNSLNNINDIENVSLKLTNVGNHNKITDHRQTSNSFNKHTAKTDVKTKKNYETLVEQTFCSVCNIYVDTHNFNAHLTSIKHNKKLGINRSNSLNNINDIENVSLKLTNVGNHNKITDHRQTSNSFNKHTAKTDVKTKKNYETLVFSASHKQNSKSFNKNKEVIDKVTPDYREVIDNEHKATANVKSDATNHKQVIDTNHTQNDNSFNESKAVIDKETLDHRQDMKIDHNETSNNFNGHKATTDVKSDTTDHKQNGNSFNDDKEIKDKATPIDNNHNQTSNEHKLFTFNQCKVIPNKYEFYCECCNIKISDVMFHINTFHHLNNFIRTCKLHDIVDCLSKLINEGLFIEPITECNAYIYRNFHSNLLRHCKMIDFNEGFVCRHCKIVMPNIKRVERLLGDSQTKSEKSDPAT